MRVPAALSARGDGDLAALKLLYAQDWGSLCLFVIKKQDRAELHRTKVKWNIAQRRAHERSRHLDVASACELCHYQAIAPSLVERPELSGLATQCRLAADLVKC
jgi:hypothetical protein